MARRRSTGKRHALVAALLALTMLIGAACDVAVAGRRCSGSGFGRDRTHILQCKNRRWTRLMTFQQYADLAAKIKAEEARAASSAARAEVAAGTSAWVDVWDWSPTFVSSKSPGALPPFTLDRIDAMAANGIQALWIQTARVEFPTDVLDRALLGQIIARAHSHGMKVFAWYLPTFQDPSVDRHLLAQSIGLGVDGVGVDIEDTSVELATRNVRLVELSQWLRATYPSLPLGAIVLPPVVTDIVNLNYWPQFPWAQLSTLYDVWMPMSYWTNRTPESGWRDGYFYTAVNIDLVRANLGMPAAPVHPIGGLSNQSSVVDVQRFVWASKERGAIGGGLYDDMISTPEQYVAITPFRR